METRSHVIKIQFWDSSNTTATRPAEINSALSHLKDGHLGILHLKPDRLNSRVRTSGCFESCRNESIYRCVACFNTCSHLRLTACLGRDAAVTFSHGCDDAIDFCCRTTTGSQNFPLIISNVR